MYLLIILTFVIVLKRSIKTKIKCMRSSQHCFKPISQQSLLWYPISTKCRAVLPFSRFRRVPKEPYGETRLIIQPQDKGSEPNCCNEAGQLLQETRVVLAASTGAVQLTASSSPIWGVTTWAYYVSCILLLRRVASSLHSLVACYTVAALGDNTFKYKLGVR